MLYVHYTSIASYYGLGYNMRELLTELRKKDKPLPIEKVHELARQVLSGLVYLHGKGVVHRDRHGRLW